MTVGNKLSFQGQCGPPWRYHLGLLGTSARNRGSFSLKVHRHLPRGSDQDVFEGGHSAHEDPPGRCHWSELCHCVPEMGSVPMGNRNHRCLLWLRHTGGIFWNCHCSCLSPFAAASYASQTVVAAPPQSRVPGWSGNRCLPHWVPLWDSCLKHPAGWFFYVLANAREPHTYDPWICDLIQVWRKPGICMGMGGDRCRVWLMASLRTSSWP